METAFTNEFNLINESLENALSEIQQAEQTFEKIKQDALDNKDILYNYSQKVEFLNQQTETDEDLLPNLQSEMQKLEQSVSDHLKEFENEQLKIRHLRKEFDQEIQAQKVQAQSAYRQTLNSILKYN